MSRYTKKESKKVGLAPGTLVYIGEKPKEHFSIEIIDFDENKIEEVSFDKVEDIYSFKETPSTTWINLDTISRTDVIEKIGNHFEIHPLVLEDIVNTNQRPKIEEYDNFYYIVLKMFYFHQDTKELTSEQVSIVLGKHYVISFQEKEGDVFEGIRKRLRLGKGKIRKSGPDYLAYTLIDSIVDHYFIVLEKLGEELERLEEALMKETNPNILSETHKIRREILFLRKHVWPLREVLSTMQKEESKLIKSNVFPYLRDVQDHVVQIIDSVETFRDMVTSIQDLYLSSLSNKMNEVMRVLTVIATIFIPLTFIAGIYGMNFQYMPELDIWWFYPLLWVFMILVAGGMLYFFRRRRWI